MFSDPDDTLAADIRRVRVVHGEQTLKVRVRLDRVVHDGSSRQQGLNLYVDTDSSDAGPELRLATGLNGGTDWNLRRVDSWNTRGRLLACDHDVDINWKDDLVVLRLTRDCLGAVSRARVALKAVEWTRTGGASSDWWGARRFFTPWVARG